MQVELKKTKITRSVVLQSLTVPHRLVMCNSGYDILGWYFDTKSKRKRVLVYKPNENRLLTLWFVEKVEVLQEERQRPDTAGGWAFPLVSIMKLNLENGNVIGYEQKEETNFEFASFVQQAKDFVVEVKSKGQIYL